ncbi:probable F-box protein At1g44080 [Lolium perenne]|jgi:hypothetical protein|uniref:probable F-box protein At1g44080 n=1 Tax=Lolium perenne TaxID=4522 RepID=UPI0021F614F9|nr:probable F-box protein At1g44080 [Lolium perenne]XP_051197637.1 probable F-box protein At1g44080 [Lolium perenne]XP_051197638.1 probable F-box protein At1g44080 [Lolium perenne]XP_051197639.1 probable F-box protein At1g44080 [Lolium perenne]XP_051197641.1 probable F-box protein At1g44080 [Lolium perenne]XP_051197642.1 probable F-box protein At1g44080 [Lolium perenne]XP_051197643.1 probable F-box protein At1g44080 [Lolium perenne]XP_051197644.1 probable F-box protein At1g44080 [Lolium pere
MMDAAQFGPWSDLPPELLSLVLKRLPSLADRVRLRAVCHPWRSNSKLHTLPLPFPWLTLPDGTFLSIPDGEVHSLTVPDDASCRGSIDNWLFIMSSDDACTLMNPFSKTTIELPNLVTVWQRMVRYESDPKQLLYKLVAPSPLDLSVDSIIASLIMDDGNIGTLCISQPPVATYSVRWNTQPLQHLKDVAFFDGKLYAVSVFGKLFIVEFCMNLGSNPNIKSVIESYGSERPECIPRDETCMYRMYLVECGGRLLMVKRFIRRLGPSSGDNVFGNIHTAGFHVLEADLLSNPCQWRRVSNLGGHALFVGQHGSKSLPATECSGSQEDCIYFMGDYLMPKYSENPLRDAGVFNMRNRTITPLCSGTAPAVLPRHADQWRPTWFFPPETV